MPCPRKNPRTLSKDDYEKQRDELEKVMAETGMKRPDRSPVLKDENTEWLYGERPDYTTADLHYLKTKTRNHAEGSLPQIVENFVKCVETELFHKTNPDQIIMTDP